MRGCSLSGAINYNPNATVQVGVSDSLDVCTFAGCTDSLASNFFSQATLSDGSCVLPITGCTDSRADNFFVAANIACPSDAAQARSADGGLLPVSREAVAASGIQCPCQIGGCTDVTNSNYDPIATFDDGSCAIAVVGCTDSRANNYLPAATVSNDACSYGGCTETDALNYNPSASFDDNTCVRRILGCTNPAADNYNPLATVPDGSCIVIGCMDPVAANYVAAATRDSGLCTYSPPATPPPTPPSPPPATPSPPPPSPRTTTDGTVSSSVLIGGGSGGWTQPPVANEQLGVSVAGVGDLNGDGVPDMAVGSRGSTVGSGAVYVALLNTSGAVSKLSVLGADLPLGASDYFGSSLASAADLDGDSLPDDASSVGGAGYAVLAAGAYGDSGEAGQRTGAAYLLFLGADGSARPDFIKLSNRSAGAIGAGGAGANVPVALPSGAEFGRSMALRTADATSRAQPPPDDATHSVELAVGAPGERGDSGAVYVFTLQVRTKVITTRRRRLQTTTTSSAATLLITRRLVPSSPAGLPGFARFGSAIAWLPQRSSIAVGAPGTDSSGLAGSLYVLDTQTSEVVELLASPLPSSNALFGYSFALGPDWNGDGQRDLVVGAPNEPNGGGAYILYSAGGGATGWTGGSYTHITAADVGVGGEGAIALGQSVAILGRVDGDLVPDLALGAPSFGAGSSGAVLTVSLAAANYPFAPPSPPPSPPSPPPAGIPTPTTPPSPPAPRPLKLIETISGDAATELMRHFPLWAVIASILLVFCIIIFAYYRCIRGVRKPSQLYNKAGAVPRTISGAAAVSSKVFDFFTLPSASFSLSPTTRYQFDSAESVELRSTPRTAPPPALQSAAGRAGMIGGLPSGIPTALFAGGAGPDRPPSDLDFDAPPGLPTLDSTGSLGDSGAGIGVLPTQGRPGSRTRYDPPLAYVPHAGFAPASSREGGGVFYAANYIEPGEEEE